MRINKYLAACGLASRRKCEELVKEGRVRLNGRPVSSLSADIKDSDIVTVDGAKVYPPDDHIYLMMNKPKGYICSANDDRGRKTVMELLPDSAGIRGKRLFPVGRLDYDSEGLLLLTTDGELCKSLTHPSGGIEKAYVCKVEGEVSQDELERLRTGVVLDGIKTKKCRVTLLENVDSTEVNNYKGSTKNTDTAGSRTARAQKKTSRVEVVLTEGRNRQVRRMFESLGRQVLFLKRVRVGTLSLGGLSRGKCRPLKIKEIEQLKKLC